MTWQFAFVVVCYGARIGVRVNDRSFFRSLTRKLPPYAEIEPWSRADRIYSVLSTAGPKVEHKLLRNRTEIGQSGDVAQMRDLLASELHESVALFSPDLFVHAGVVGWKGRAIVIPGVTMSGKTTLVAELVRQGASYFSDEYAVIGEDGWVHNYPKPLSIRGAQGKRRQVSAEALGGRTGSERLPLGLVAVARHQAGATWTPRVLSEAESMMALIANTVTARKRPEMTMQRLSRAVQGTVGLEGQRGNAKQTARELIESVDRLLRQKD